MTALDNRVVGAPILFKLDKLDPAWRVGARAAIDWGDGAPPFTTTIEAIRQGQLLEHRYKSPSSVFVTAVVAEGFAGKNVRSAQTELGEGATRLLIAPSPITGARALADAFLNERFALALSIALIVYLWRYQSRATVFGAHSFDYVESFALGFAANAAVSNLAGALIKFVP